MTHKELRQIRDEHDLTQRELGELLGYNANYIARLERGEAPITKRLEKMLRAFFSTQTRRRHIISQGNLTLREWEELKAAYDSRCAYCGKKQERLSQDHVIALDNGGQHRITNIVPACRSCNSRKGNRETMVPMKPSELQDISMGI